MKRGRLPPESIRGVFQQQAESVAVACHRVRAGMKLGCKPFREEPLHVRGEGVNAGAKVHQWAGMKMHQFQGLWESWFDFWQGEREGDFPGDFPLAIAANI